MKCPAQLMAIDSTLDSTEGSLKERGVRLTRQRQILLELIDKTGEHLDAERLFQMAKEKDPKLNRVTVYRTLKMLKAGGLVDELDLMHYGGDQHYYETRLKQEHAHVICLRCGKVEEFFGEPLQRLRKQIESHFGFQVLLARTEVGGYCAHCQTLRAREVEELREPAAGTGKAGRHAEPVKRRRAEPRGAAQAHAAEVNGARIAGGRRPQRPPHARAARPAAFPHRPPAGKRPDHPRQPRFAHARAHSGEEGGYVIEDCGSRHGTFVNGTRITRHMLENSDRIEFGVPDSYQLIFALDGAELKSLMEQMGAAENPASAPHGVGGNLAKLRAILDLARTLQSSFSVDDVLAQVVDTALAITGAERGFLMLRKGDGAGDARGATTGTGAR